VVYDQVIDVEVAGFGDSEAAAVNAKRGPRA